MLTEARRPSLRFSGFKLWKQLREPASTACLGSQPFCPYLIISMFPSVVADHFSFPVQQSVQRSDIKPTARNDSVQQLLVKHVLKIECVHLSSIHTAKC